MQKLPSIAALLLSGASLISAAHARDVVSVASKSDGAPASGQGAADIDRILKEFANPPQSARPRVWWHWLNGNITKDGIRKDIEWMKRAGIGGMQAFDADLFTPTLVSNRLVFMHPEWKDAFRYAATLADQNGLELAIASSPGFSETGGPWVKPQDGLKKLVWSETTVKGGRRVRAAIAAPPKITGPYQDLPKVDEMTFGGGGAPASYYADVAVLAYPVVSAPQASATLTGADGATLDAGALADDSLATTVEVARGADDAIPALTLKYGRPRTIRSATLFVAGGKGAFTGSTIAPLLEASDDGVTWRAVGEWTVGKVPTTISFAPVTARRFRVAFRPLASKPIALGDPAPGVDTSISAMGAAGNKPKSIRVAELHLSEEGRIHEFERKAAFDITSDHYALERKLPDQKGIDPKRVLNITDRMQADGTLDWIPPKGTWRIVRFGYSLLGTTNHPATREATGLEVDKFDGPAVRAYLDHYLGMYRDATGPGLMGERGVRALLTDSIEVGPANWTPRMMEQFRRLRGYDPTPWLPALTGAVVGSPEQSDKFLYDYRRTLADLLASEHYGVVATVAHENGLKVYGEALEDRRPMLGDDMAMRVHTDVPMAAMWTFNKGSSPRTTLIGDIKGAASVAHIYGQNLVAAESLTSISAPWAHAPSDLRRVIDLEFALGVNLPVIHTSVHQPLDKVPGIPFFIIGQYFNRHESWAEMAKPWVDYMARNSYLLQQGRNVADVAYFYGEERPLTSIYDEKPLGDAPHRYAYDFANADVVLNRLNVDNGDLVAPGGARYRALYLGGSSARMTLPVLRRLAELVQAGATVVGNAPEASPALNDDPAAFGALVRQLWSGSSTSTVGRGRVIAGADIEKALAEIGVIPDFEYAKPQADSEILFVHRKLADGDSYFLSNRRDRAEHVEARFRVSGKAPEIWRADTGSVEPVSYRTEGGVTIVPLDIAPEDSFFVVFRKPASAPSVTIAPKVLTPVQTISGAWSVAFQAERGAPASTTLETLAPLNESSDAGVRYFSGVATYAKTFDLARRVKPGAPLKLDLGGIGDVAEVRVNGQSVGAVWHAPYQLDIGKAVRRGRNRIEVRVVNLWVNRLIGDAQKGAKKVTSTTLPTYRADAPLRPSGLWGPVTILSEGR